MAPVAASRWVELVVEWGALVGVSLGCTTTCMHVYSLRRASAAHVCRATAGRPCCLTQPDLAAWRSRKHGAQRSRKHGTEPFVAVFYLGSVFASLPASLLPDGACSTATAWAAACHVAAANTARDRCECICAHMYIYIYIERERERERERDVDLFFSYVRAHVYAQAFVIARVYGRTYVCACNMCTCMYIYTRLCVHTGRPTREGALLRLGLFGFSGPRVA